MNKKFIIVLIFLLTIATSVVYAAEASQIEITSADVLKNGDVFNITLTGADGTPIANEDVNITVTDALGEQNNVSTRTVDNGQSCLVIDGVTPGKYTFNCTFYGNDKYDQSSASQELTIE